MIAIVLQRHEKRKARARVLWAEWLKKYTDKSNPMSAQEIADSYINPVTGKNYTRQHVHNKLRQISNGTIKL